MQVHVYVNDKTSVKRKKGLLDADPWGDVDGLRCLCDFAPHEFFHLRHLEK
jgi:hypothetical protein